MTTYGIWLSKVRRNLHYAARFNPAKAAKYFPAMSRQIENRINPWSIVRMEIIWSGHSAHMPEESNHRELCHGPQSLPSGALMEPSSALSDLTK